MLPAKGRSFRSRRFGGIDGNDCHGGQQRHQQNRMTDRQRAAQPDERARRENPASPAQVGPPVTVTDPESTGRPNTLCIRPGTGDSDVKPILGPDSPGRFRGPGYAKIRSTAQRSAGSEKLVRPRKSRTAQTAPTLVRAARGAGRKRTGACQDLNLGLPRGSEREREREREREARRPGSPAEACRRRGEAAGREGARGAHAPRRGGDMHES